MKVKRIVYIISLFIILILNCLYVDYQFFFLLLMTLMVPAISYALFCISAWGLRIYAKFDRDYTSKGETISLNIKAEKKVGMSIPWGKLNMSTGFSNVSLLDSKAVDFVPKKKNNSFAISFTPQHCGILSFYPEKLEIRDYLGLFNKISRYNSVKRAVIMPIPVVIDNGGNIKDFASEEHMVSYFESDNTEILDLRYYRDGDSMNRIHWKKSFNSEDFVVKQYGQEVRKKNKIVVDLTKSTEKEFLDNLDSIYTAVYSIGLLYTENGLGSSIVTWSSMDLSVVEFDFSNEGELTDAIVLLMSESCSPECGYKLAEYFDNFNHILEDEYVFITANDGFEDFVNVVDVRKDNLEDILFEMCNNTEEEFQAF